MSKEPVYSPPAFPVPDLKTHHYKGLTKREYIAIAAMQAILNTSTNADSILKEHTAKIIAGEAYLMADAMIERGQQ